MKLGEGFGELDVSLHTFEIIGYCAWATKDVAPGSKDATGAGSVKARQDNEDLKQLSAEHQEAFKSDKETADKAAADAGEKEGLTKSKLQMMTVFFRIQYQLIQFKIIVPKRVE